MHSDETEAFHTYKDMQVNVALLWHRLIMNTDMHLQETERGKDEGQIGTMCICTINGEGDREDKYFDVPLFYEFLWHKT